MKTIKLKDIPYIIPTAENKDEIISILENNIVSFLNKNPQLDIIDGILGFCEKNDFRVEDIEDYIEASEVIKNLAMSKKIQKDNKLSGLGFF